MVEEQRSHPVPVRPAERLVPVQPLAQNRPQRLASVRRQIQAGAMDKKSVFPAERRLHASLQRLMGLPDSAAHSFILPFPSGQLLFESSRSATVLAGGAEWRVERHSAPDQPRVRWSKGSQRTGCWR